MDKTPKKRPQSLSAEESKQLFEIIGLVAGAFSKAILEMNGHVVDYKINGQPISELKTLTVLDIAGKIKLAVEQERYEDAAALKKLLDQKK